MELKKGKVIDVVAERRRSATRNQLVVALRNLVAQRSSCFSMLKAFLSEGTKSNITASAQQQVGYNSHVLKDNIGCSSDLPLLRQPIIRHADLFQQQNIALSPLNTP